MGEGENSLAKQISADPLFKDVIIIAPNTSLVVENREEIGPYYTKKIFNRRTLKSENKRIEAGRWNVFQNGKKLTDQPYYWKPNPNTSNSVVKSIAKTLYVIYKTTFYEKRF